MQQEQIYTVTDSLSCYFFVGTENEINLYKNIMKCIDEEIECNFLYSLKDEKDYSKKLFKYFFHEKGLSENFIKQDIIKYFDESCKFFNDNLKIEEYEEELIEQNIFDFNCNLLLYNSKFNKAFICNFENIEKVLESSKDLHLIKGYDMANTKRIDVIKNFFKSNTFYNNIQEIFDKIDDIERIFDIYKKPIEETIKDYIETYYTISKDQKDKIKASIIFENINLLIEENVKQKITLVLESLGVKKKRFTEGIFFIGIKNIELVDLKKNRDNDMKKIYLEQEEKIRFN